VLFWALAFMLFFAWLYSSIPFEPWLPDWLIPSWFYVAQSPINPQQFNLSTEVLTGFWQWLFISFDIFSNLGIRSTQAQNPLGVILIMTETMLGLMMFGMLISVMGERFARRS
jgi:hypothetical protein